MEIIQQLVMLLTHTADYLKVFVQHYGALVYVLMFLIVFAETGLVVTPFLPGDSLLFAAGALASTAVAQGSDKMLLSLPAVIVVFMLAAFLGDNTNYWFGHYFGPKVMSRDGRILKRKYLDMTQDYFDHYGSRTVVIARFVPIVRTFAPFMAGVGRMRYRRFIGYSVVGAVLWVGVFVTIGYFFARIPWVAEHFELALIGVLVFSTLPAVYEFIRHRLKARKKARQRVDAAIDEAAVELAEREL